MEVPYLKLTCFSFIDFFSSLFRERGKGILAHALWSIAGYRLSESLDYEARAQQTILQVIELLYHFRLQCFACMPRVNRGVGAVLGHQNVVEIRRALRLIVLA